MTRSLILTVPALIAAVAPAADAREPWRPLYHFTPAKNWMNDPNGMVFHNGRWHLFYQYNPEGDRWGHMSWGHAVSSDLLHWEHLPLALPEEDGIMIFSGSAVTDPANTSGFGKDGKPPMVAIYTGHTDSAQNQCLAYSNDDGLTWTKFPGNPVLDAGKKDFRDPKVMWHEPTNQWVMTIALPTEHKISFYASPDLKKWRHLSDFGPAGTTAGIWECPDLFPMTVEGTGETKWVLIVNLNPGGPAGGSGCQYFVGTFDGTKFVQDPLRPQRAGNALWLDHGPDFYAAVTWAGVPDADGRRVALGWMSNWEYAQDVPTAPWRSAMTVPRELTLRKTPQDLRLAQQPVREIATLAGTSKSFAGGTAAEANAWLTSENVTGNALDITVTLKASASGEFGLEVLSDGEEQTRIGIDPAHGVLFIDRSKSGNTTFHPKFTGRAVARMPQPAAETVTLRVLVDACSVEVFANDGLTAVTSLVFPSPSARTVSVFGAERTGAISARVFETAP